MILKPPSKQYIQNLATISVQEEDIEIITNTKEYRTKLLELISTAKNRIYLTALYLQDDEAGKEILTALYEAKQKNPKLDIKVFVDFLRAQRGLMGHAKSEGNVRLYRELKEKYQHPVDVFGVPVKNKEFLGVLHIKGFVFDDTLLYSGSSINNVYLHQNERYRYDRYHLINSKELAHSFVRFLQENFVKNDAVKPLNQQVIPNIKNLKMAIRKLKTALRRSSYFVKSKPTKETKAVKLTPLLGLGGRKNRLNDTIYHLISQTEQEVVIFTPYFNFPAKINKAVRKLLRNKKKVVIVVGDKTANDFYLPENEEFNKIGIVPYIYETSLRRFIKANQKYIDQMLLDVFLWLDSGNSFHLKGINSDKKNYLITGHNLNPRAWRLDIENGILIQDEKQKLINKFDAELAEIMKHCSRVGHFNEIETIDDYRPEAKTLLRKVKRAKLDSILNRLL